MFRKNRGFTLIELLVVISIIGVLSSVTLTSMQAVKLKAKETKNFVEIKEFMKALEVYKLDNGTYPGNFGTYYVSSQNGIANTCNKGNGTLWTSIFDNTFTSKYMSKLPSENVPCGIIYVKFSAQNQGNPTIACKQSMTDDDGYTLQDYGYFLILLTEPNSMYKNLGYVLWQYVGAPSANTDQKCIPGPQI